MTTSYSPTAIWLMIAVIGAGTFLIRISFLALLSRVETIPPLAVRILRLIPAAVLAAITVPGLTNAEGTFDLGTTRFAAGVIAALVAWRTKNVLATIVVGMGALWIIEALV
jgi:branched-subunit amino acid transport protein